MAGETETLEGASASNGRGGDSLRIGRKWRQIRSISDTPFQVPPARTPTATPVIAAMEWRSALRSNRHLIDSSIPGGLQQIPPEHTFRRALSEQ